MDGGSGLVGSHRRRSCVCAVYAALIALINRVCFSFRLTIRSFLPPPPKSLHPLSNLTRAFNNELAASTSYLVGRVWEG